EKKGEEVQTVESLLPWPPTDEKACKSGASDVARRDQALPYPECRRPGASARRRVPIFKAGLKTWQTACLSRQISCRPLSLDDLCCIVGPALEWGGPRLASRLRWVIPDWTDIRCQT